MTHRGRRYYITEKYLGSQLSFKPLSCIIATGGEKIDLIAEKCHFWPKFQNSKCPNSVICHSLRGLTYKSVCSSLSTIRIYRSHTWIIPGIRPSWTKFQGLRLIMSKTRFFMNDHKLRLKIHNFR